jgi:hypothetical protein
VDLEDIEFLNDKDEVLYKTRKYRPVEIHRLE